MNGYGYPWKEKMKTKMLKKDWNRRLAMAWVVLALPAVVATAATNRYVSTTGTHDTGGGYVTEAGAATNLQAAIDVCAVGDTVWVENGFVTDTGGRIGYPSGTVLTNRVVIDKAITVRSMSGDTNNTPMIVGAWDLNTAPPSVPNNVGAGIGLGPEAVRCLYLANEAQLIGFTLTNGATFHTTAAKDDDKRGGGVFCASTSSVLSNCIVRANLANGGGGGIYRGSLYDCFIENNAVEGSYTGGGGAYGGNYWRCVFTENSAYRGGGAYNGTSYDCRFTGNVARDHGGGASKGTSYRCLFIGNVGTYGGGGSEGSFYNCVMVSNTVSAYGGAAHAAKLYNSTLLYNEAIYTGGGAYKSVLTNSISWYNNKPDAECTSIAYSCGEGYINDGNKFVGNIDVDPQLVDPAAGLYGLRGSSPCVNTGINFSWMTAAGDPRSLDFDSARRVRYDVVDMGAFETVLFGTQLIIR